MLFLSAGLLNQQFHSNKIEHMQNVFKLQPIASAGLIIGGIAIVGLPPFPIFISKLSILLQTIFVSPLLTLGLLILLTIAAVSMGNALVRIFSTITENKDEEHNEEHNERNFDKSDVENKGTNNVSKSSKFIPSFGMKISIIVLAAIILILGLYIGDLKNFIDLIIYELQW